jgi:hypothetical protein
MRIASLLFVLLTASILTAGCALQERVEAPAPDGSAEAERYRLFLERSRIPNPAGTGPYPAIKEEDPGLPDHVVYRPANLAQLEHRKLPLYVFGNGACSGDGASARLHLLEIASHGYLAIASGRIRSGPGLEPPPPPLPAYQNQTTSAQLTEAIDWALAENARRGSPYYAVSGHSCGGLQALQVAADPRISTLVVMYSGIYNDEGPGRSGMVLRKDHLQKIHTPVLYVLGGKTDMAYPNGMDDFARISHVPAFVANIDVGHGGTFWEPNGGWAAQVVVNWLNWQLKGDLAAQTWFVGEKCRLCVDPAWTIDRKHLG